MNVKLLPYVGAYLGGQIAGITLVAVIAKKVMPQKTPSYGFPIGPDTKLPNGMDLSSLYK